MRTTGLAVAVLASIVWLSPAPATAQGYIAPSLGTTFANPSAQGRADFVADLGWLSRFEPLGVEFDAMYAPSFFGNQGPFGDNSVTTIMGNVIVAGHGGGRRGAGAVRPYVSGGIGIMNEVVTTTEPGDRISNNDLGVNLGVGVMAFSRRSVGIRADVRYFRDLIDNQKNNRTTVDFGSFHFWRASIGVVLAF